MQHCKYYIIYLCYKYEILGSQESSPVLSSNDCFIKEPKRKHFVVYYIMSLSLSSSFVIVIFVDIVIVIFVDIVIVIFVDFVIVIFVHIIVTHL